MSAPKHVTVLGGGLTGLVAAYRLAQQLPASSKVSLIEGSDRLGGWVNSASHHLDFTDKEGRRRQGEVVIEGGPRSIRPKGSKGAAGMLKLVREVGLEKDIIAIPTTHPSARNRFILDPTSSPPSLKPLRPHPFGSALSLPTLSSALLEPFRPAPTRRPDDDESIDSFLRRRFGPGVAQLASAGMHGIYAASTTSLSAKAILGSVYDAEREYGSVIMGLIRRSFSATAKTAKAEDAARWAELGELGETRKGWAMYGLRGGIGALTSRLSDRVREQGVNVRVSAPVSGIAADPHGLSLSLGDETLSSSHIVSALSLRSLSSLVPSLPVSDTTMTSVGVVTLVYPTPPFHPEGFGYLIPRPASSAYNPEGILGVIFESTALPGLDSCPGITKLTVMMGGPYWSTYEPVIPIPHPEDLVSLAQAHLRRVFPVLKDMEPILSTSKLQRDCIPTYTPGHGSRMAALHNAITQGPLNGRLSLVGNAYAGVGVNDCVWSAESAAGSLAAGKSPTGLEQWARL